MSELKKSCNHVILVNFIILYVLGSGIRTDNSQSTYGMPIEEAEKNYMESKDTDVDKSPVISITQLILHYRNKSRLPTLK